MRSSRIIFESLAIATLLMASAATGSAAELLGVRTSANDNATTLFLNFGSPVDYSPIWVDSRTFALDVAGTGASALPSTQSLNSPLVRSYRVFSYKGTDDTSHLRVELSLKSSAKIDAQQSVKGLLAIKVEPGSSSESVPDPEVRKPEKISKAVPSIQKAGTEIREIQVSKIEGTPLLEVEVVGNGAFDYHTMRLTNPERLVIDIPNAHNQVRQKALPVNAAPLKSVRVGQLSTKPLVSRIVMDLNKKTGFNIRRQDGSLVVTLGTEEKSEPAADKVSRVAETVPDVKAEKQQAPKAAEKPATAVSAPVIAGKAAKEVAKSTTASAKPLSTPVKAAPALAVHEAPPVEVSAKTGSSEKTSAASEKFTVAAKPERTPAPVEIATQKPESISSAVTFSTAKAVAAPAPASATPSEPIVKPSPSITETSQMVAAAKMPMPPQQASPVTPIAASYQSAPQQSAQQAGGKTYTGEPISVNLKDVDLKDFFRLIHEISGLNIVLDPAVSGVVTIVLDEVPWDQALEIVMKNNSLGKEVEGSVVRIAKLSTLESEEKQRRDLALAVQSAQPKVTVTRTLSYAKAAEMIVTLKKFLTDRGDMIADLRTNTIIITDVPSVIPTVDRLIQGLDQKSQQVEIEARVVSASRSFARDIGTQLAASGLTGNVVLGGAGAVGTSPIKRGTTPPMFVGTPPAAPLPGQPVEFANISQPLLTNFAAAASSGFSFLLTGKSFALDSIITAAESKGIGKLLSRPKIITQNNVEATVKQGVKIPIQTTVNNTISVQYVDVVLRLTVTPQITAEGTIFLKTDIENTSIDPGIATVPGQFGLDTQSAQTQVLVSNGGTVFFGGVVQNVNRLNEAQVPLLGSIPLIGSMFKRKTTTSTTNELLFFITPRIVQS